MSFLRMLGEGRAALEAASPCAGCDVCSAKYAKAAAPCQLSNLTEARLYNKTVVFLTVSI
jgi:hypothetical protein